MTTTYDVRIWKIKANKGASTTSYTVRWKVDGREWQDTFKTRALADSFRSDLLSAAGKGEAFDVATGRPVSMARTANDMTFFEFACAYAEMKWAGSAGNSRKGVAETLTTVMPAMLASSRGKPADKTIRRALQGWSFNLYRRDSIEAPEDVRAALKWLADNTKNVSTLSDASVARSVMNRIAQKLDGQPAAPATVKRKRSVWFNALEYAVERKLLTTNPIPGLKIKTPKTLKAIDKRVVVNHKQALRLLDAVRAQRPAGKQQVAYFASMYYSALRPGEAVNLRKPDLLIAWEVWNEGSQQWELPAGDDGWGELLLWESAPETGAAWSSTGLRRDRRELKHRAKGDTRPVPCPPQLTALLNQHVREFGTNADGFLFRGVRDTGQLSESTYSRAWRKARKAALTPEEFASPLARRPYQLRHAAVSTWLNGGVAPTQVAEWAGHSVAVLLQIYAKCIAGQETTARKRIESALNEE